MQAAKINFSTTRYSAFEFLILARRTLADTDIIPAESKTAPKNNILALNAR